MLLQLIFFLYHLILVPLPVFLFFATLTLVIKFHCKFTSGGFLHKPTEISKSWNLAPPKWFWILRTEAYYTVYCELLRRASLSFFKLIIIKAVQVLKFISSGIYIEGLRVCIPSVSFYTAILKGFAFSVFIEFDKWANVYEVIRLFHLVICSFQGPWSQTEKFNHSWMSVACLKNPTYNY